MTENDYAQLQAMGQAQRDAGIARRIKELEDALKPFAEAVNDDDVKLLGDSAALWTEDDRFFSNYHIIAAGEDSEGDGIILEVRHLRAAAEALKGKAE